LSYILILSQNVETSPTAHTTTQTKITNFHGKIKVRNQLAGPQKGLECNS